MYASSLKNQTALAVTRALYELFGLFGAPKILQSDNGKEFINGFINALINVWPQMKIIHGRARFPQAQLKAVLKERTVMCRTFLDRG